MEKRRDEKLRDLSNSRVLHVKKENQEFIQFRRLTEYSDIVEHCYSVGIDKNYRTFKANKTPLPEEEYLKNVNNYISLCKANDLNYINVVKTGQAHTDNVKIINEKINKDKPDFEFNDKIDGLITNKKDIILATTNADCILLLFFDPVKKVVANTHSGWRGTLQEISVKTVDKMEKEYGCSPRDIIVCICPSIRKCHFEVDKDVYELFYNKFKKLGNTEEFITKNNDKWFIDTVLINKLILKQAGILEENIEDSGICSMCNKDKIHSFRAEGTNYGLATALIMLK